ncbi:reverse transcriptase domain-containing protein [Tanacetum coccineum]
MQTIEGAMTIVKDIWGHTISGIKIGELVLMKQAIATSAVNPGEAEYVSLSACKLRIEDDKSIHCDSEHSNEHLILERCGWKDDRSRDVHLKTTNVHAKEPLVVNHDKPIESNKVLDKDQPQTSNEPVVQRFSEFPSKEKDPGSFTIPYDIGQLHINNALADLGDIPEDSRDPIILGRPVLATARAMIDVFNKNKMLRVGDDEVIFDIDQSIKRPPAEDDECYGIDDLDNTINAEAQELLANDKISSRLRSHPKDQEKTRFTCLYGTFAYRRMLFGLCNAPATFQRCMTEIFYDMVKDFMEVFMDYFSVFSNSFNCCLANLDRMLSRCKETNLVLNWEKCYFMVKEGIVLGHKIPGQNAPFELMCDASDFAVGVVLGQRIDRKFKPICYASKTLNNAQEHYATTEKELLTVVFSFDKFHPYLIFSKTIVYTDHSALKYLFRAENLAADHLSRLENPDLGTFTEEEITNEFPNEHLMILKAELDDDEPWYADYVNYIVGKIVLPKWTPEKRRRFFSQVKNYFWDEPYAFRLCSENIMRRCVAGSEILEILAHCHFGPTEGHHSASITGRKVYESGFF